MSKKKSKSEDYLNNFFESSRYTIPDLKSDLKERILKDAGKINSSYNSTQIPFHLNHRMSLLHNSCPPKYNQVYQLHLPISSLLRYGL